MCFRRGFVKNCVEVLFAGIAPDNRDECIRLLICNLSTDGDRCTRRTAEKDSVIAGGLSGLSEGSLVVNTPNLINILKLHGLELAIFPQTFDCCVVLSEIRTMERSRNIRSLGINSNDIHIWILFRYVLRYSRGGSTGPHWTDDVCQVAGRLLPQLWPRPLVMYSWIQLVEYWSSQTPLPSVAIRSAVAR